MTRVVVVAVQQVMNHIDSLILEAQKRGVPGEPVVSVTF